MDDRGIVMENSCIEYVDEENEIYISIRCVSELTDCWLGVGVAIDESSIVNDEVHLSKVKIGDVFDSFEEGWWELIFEFNWAVKQALEDGIISDTKREDLFKVFGHFRFIYAVGEDFVNEKDCKTIELGVDPDQYMYDILEEYIPYDD